ncbi:pepF/M3 family oligoendopeptidase [Paenibacillus phyllosphaerae]|uniref:PepF/M3 family oligoendopeptidase n=1 Tax=Paenibacillus phyllosphaerae TaxID=274593 RepID=A0A7W5FQ71_9BACL|nr:M3 family oligoendopeptidase [Paenibacillus phyllosphaerae]MBB3112917.1 pepF/M3 family oligoendopeptidase [Paenibacillus phyllosphaerae]
MSYPQTWNLDVIYAGGSNSAEFKAELEGMERDIDALASELAAVKGGQQSAGTEQLTAWTGLVQSILIRLRQTDAFVGCLLAENMKDTAAAGLNDRVRTISAKFNTALTSYDEQLTLVAEETWSGWLKQEDIAPVAFVLQERRSNAKEKLAPALEALAGELAVDGYHGWGEFYNTIVSRTQFHTTDKNGEAKTLSVGQMANKLSDGDRAVREEGFDHWERVWGEQAELCAEALNRLSGFRLKLYEKRGWQDVLKEPLSINRMSEATLNAMWSAVNEGKADLVRYLDRKAQLLGIDKMDWHDVDAPIGSASRTVPYDEGAALILDSFRKFSSDLADFSEMAFRDGWIEAEDRPGKRPGGFCTSLPISEQTRIFMTYSGTASNISTLAHELGHAYHQHVMNDLKPLAQEYAMNVAETASTFAELILADATLEAAKDEDEKLAMLEDKIQRSTAFFMNIHARFLFETRFYEKRRSGMVTVEELNQLMQEAQEEAFSGALGKLHPHFWAAKLHFYITEVPFYNYPYTFGYLFSCGLYAIAKKEGPSFADRYVALLRDTGIMTVEELALKHLGVRLDEPEFWRGAVSLTSQDVEAFLAMTEK